MQTFRKQSQSLLQQSKPTLSINEQQIQRSFENVIQQHFTLSMLYRYIDEIHISKTKALWNLFQNEPLNIVTKLRNHRLLN